MMQNNSSFQSIRRRKTPMETINNRIHVIQRHFITHDYDNNDSNELYNNTINIQNNPKTQKTHNNTFFSILSKVFNCRNQIKMNHLNNNQSNNFLLVNINHTFPMDKVLSKGLPIDLSKELSKDLSGNKFQISLTRNLFMNLLKDKKNSSTTIGDIESWANLYHIQHNNQTQNLYLDHDNPTSSSFIDRKLVFIHETLQDYCPLQYHPPLSPSFQTILHPNFVKGTSEKLNHLNNNNTTNNITKNTIYETDKQNINDTSLISIQPNALNQNETNKWINKQLNHKDHEIIVSKLKSKHSIPSPQSTSQFNSQFTPPSSSSNQIYSIETSQEGIFPSKMELSRIKLSSLEPEEVLFKDGIKCKEIDVLDNLPKAIQDEIKKIISKEGIFY